ncbi:MAG: hypothetical protein IJ491_04440 [Clostridia bacterium]|nr:hypothetical protein [Clostridia bacterium]
MIKLFTLRNLSAFSGDAVYKICLSLEDFGLTEEKTVTFDSYDELFSEAVVALERGEHILVAAENSDYNSFKRDLIGKLLLEEYSCPGIADSIAMNAGDDVSEIDMTGHTLVPHDCVYHLSVDGLYSGFTCDALMGRLSCVPLDFERVDTIIEALKEDILVPLMAAENGEPVPIKMPDFDFVPCISDMVSSLNELEKTIALATSEATMWIYNLYDKVEAFNDALRFVEVIDEDEEEETTAESESVRIIRHAREAMINSGSDFGGAISEIYSTENEAGQTVYFAYAAVVDRGNAKAKKINTMNPDDLVAILPHAVTVLADLVRNKTAALKAELDGDDNEAELEPKAEESKKMSKNMLIFAIVILTIAVISPIILAVSLFGGEDPTTSQAPGISYNPSTDVIASVSSTSPSTTSYNPFTTSQNQGQINNVGATEPSASDVSAATTVAPAPSTSGTFTFNVFGYGHGVGMSQEGADYLARQGWQWAEILAHYYYNINAVIVTGDSYPETISYAGSNYNTRDFLASALEAEMGTGMHTEALKAQVVAIYTFAKYYAFNLSSDACAILGSGRTPSAQSYAVVDEMMGIAPYISYNGSCAMTPFHAMSAGMTTAYYNVWGKEYSADLPYLGGARKSYGDYLEDDYATTYSISSEDLKALVKANADIELTGDPATWLTILSHDSAVDSNIGYVSSINVGGKIMTGNDFRTKVMEGRIRSHCFIITYTPDSN